MTKARRNCRRVCCVASLSGMRGSTNDSINDRLKMDESIKDEIRVLLMEKRRANVKSFDSSPCFNATIDDLDIRLFKH